MDNNKHVHQGEILMLLSKRSHLDGAEIAEKMGISRNYLSDIYRRERLSKKIIASAANVFGVEVSIFDTGIGYSIPNSTVERVGESGDYYKSLLEEVERLKDENARQAAEILRERQVSDDLRRALLLIAGKKIED